MVTDEKVYDRLHKAVKELEDAANDMGIGSRAIGEAFDYVHPHLKNQICLGILKSISDKSDGRINPRIVEFAEQM